MEEKSAEFLENYDFSVHHITRVRGAYVLTTDKGTKLLKEYGGTEKRASSEQKVLQHIRAEGMPFVDCYVPNKEGLLITKDELPRAKEMLLFASNIAKEKRAYVHSKEKNCLNEL